MKRPLNLASRPFRNERLPTMALLVGCVVLLGLSVHHALAARDLLPARTSSVDGELVALEGEVARLRRESDRLWDRGASSEALREWAVVRGLVDRRAFSWSGLLGHLEGVVPADVRLLSIAPQGSEGRIDLTVRAVGRTVEDGLEFLEALQAQAEFEQPFLTSVAETRQGIDLNYTMSYVPGRSAPGGER